MTVNVGSWPENLKYDLTDNRLRVAVIGKPLYDRVWGQKEIAKSLIRGENILTALSASFIHLNHAELFSSVGRRISAHCLILFSSKPYCTFLAQCIETIE